MSSNKATERLARTFRGVLPRSLDPLPDEALPSYLLRLGCRLERSPMDIAQICGLTIGSSGRFLPGRLLLSIPRPTLQVFVAATRLTEDEAAALTMTPHLGAALPAPRADGTVHPHSLRRAWAPLKRTRACPDCLEESGGRPGYWRRSWRLPWHFACTTHHRLLLDACPECEHPFGRVRRLDTLGELIPGAYTSGLAVDQCRAKGGDDDTRHHRHDQIGRCGHALRLHVLHGEPGDLASEDGALAAQDRLLAATDPENAETLTIGGTSATPGVWFTSLRNLCELLRLSRPDQPVTPLSPALAEPLDDLHVARARAGDNRDAAKALVDRGTPPATAALAGALAVQALDLLDTPDWDTLADRVRPLAERARHLDTELYEANPDRVDHPLQRLLRPRQADSVLNTWAARTPAASTKRWGFEARHVRHGLEDRQYEQHLVPFLDLVPQSRRNRERVLRDAASVALVQLAYGCTQRRAADLLGMSYSGVVHDLQDVDQGLRRTTRAGEFTDALHAVADGIDSNPARTDHGRRRDALADWFIPDLDWDALRQALAALARAGKPVDWDLRRIYCSVVVWERITGGDPLYAPARRHATGVDPKRFATCLSAYRSKVADDRPSGTRDTLLRYVDEVTTRIDRSDPVTAPATSHACTISGYTGLDEG